MHPDSLATMASGARPSESVPPAPYLRRPISELTADDMWAFYQVTHEEVAHPAYSELHRRRLLDYKSGMGPMLSREAYFKQNYCAPLRNAVAAIFSRFPNPRILDVCCGTGTQSILFALLGGTVVGLDYHGGQLETFRQRLAFYREKFQVELPIDTFNADAKSVDFPSFGVFDAVYSHIGIGRLETAEAIFRRLGRVLRPGGLLILKNGNPQCLWLRAVGRASCDDRRGEYLRCAKANGFEVIRATGTAGLPRPLWRFGTVSRALDGVFRPFTQLQLSIEYIFRKAA